MNIPANPKYPSVIVQLKDGREIDISGLPPGAAIEHLQSLGVALRDIENTYHFIPKRKDAV